MGNSDHKLACEVSFPCRSFGESAFQFSECQNLTGCKASKVSCYLLNHLCIVGISFWMCLVANNWNSYVYEDASFDGSVARQVCRRG